jgi:glycosyl transferase family 2
VDSFHPLRRTAGGLRARVARWLVGLSRADVAALPGAIDELRGELRAATAERAATLEELAGLRAALTRSQEDSSRLGAQLAGLSEGVGNLEEHARRLELQARILPTMAWVEQADVPARDLISVILPTRDRGVLLHRAMASVLAQSYPRWELIVVDDGSTDDTDRVVAAVRDDRVRLERLGGGGPAAGRNRGLEVARGEVVVYLDDDNAMHPLWLKAVAWALAMHQEAQVAYGARVIEDSRGLGIDTADLSAPIHFEPFDRRRLEEGNFIDIGVLAHRGGMAQARFDETLAGLEDWDMILRLTRDRPALPLPAIAVLYSTTAPGRLSDRPDKAHQIATITSRLDGRRGDAG